MMRRRRWPFDEIDRLRSEVESLFEGFFTSEELEQPMWDVTGRSLEPLTEIVETPDELIVTADLPLVEKEDLKVNASERSLTIEANFCRKVRFEHWVCDQGRTDFDTITKTIRLPVDVKPDEAKASFRQGILEVRLPKKITQRTIKVE